MCVDIHSWMENFLADVGRNKSELASEKESETERKATKGGREKLNQQELLAIHKMLFASSAIEYYLR